VRGVKRLYLLRHAKSSWKDTALADHDRPLSGRGRRAARAVGRHMLAAGIEPQLVLCSTALRARETLAGIEPALGSGRVRVERQLYGASATVLLARVRRLPDTVESVLLIAHDPGVQELTLRLARPTPELAALAEKYPTGTLAELEFEFDGEHWRALDDGGAALTGVVRPRDLEA
jgi:phosphohistidine phosphatase